MTQPPYGPGGGPDYGPPPSHNPYGTPPAGMPGGGATGGPGAPPPPPPPGGGYPAYGSREQQPSKGLAIAAFVLSFFACTVIAAIAAIVMAVMVLVRGRDGRNHGKGFAIAAIVISILSVLAAGAAVVAIVFAVESFEDVDELRTGDCFWAESFSSEDRYDVVDVVDCDEAHDAEVMAAIELDAAQAQRVRDGEAAELCNEAAPLVPDREGLEFLYLTEEDLDRDVEEGDWLACIARNADGDELTEPLR